MNGKKERIVSDIYPAMDCISLNGDLVSASAVARVVAVEEVRVR